jgi:hypothetical protein
LRWASPCHPLEAAALGWAGTWSCQSSCR